MSYPTPTINVAAGDVFQKLFDTVNLFSNLFTYSVVTANSSANGAVTTGNVWINGVSGALEMVVGSLSGGNVASPNTLNITSNVVIGNLSLYQNGFISAVSTNTVVANTVQVGNVTISTSGVSVNAVPVALANSSVSFKSNGTPTSTRGALNLISGPGISVTVSDDAADGQANVIISLSAGSNNVPVISVAGVSGPSVGTANLQAALGLGNSAYLGVGTGANTVAAGNDARIVGAASNTDPRIVGAAQLSGAAFTGAVTVPTLANTENSSKAAPSSFVQNVVNNAVTPVQTMAKYLLCMSM